MASAALGDNNACYIDDVVLMDSCLALVGTPWQASNATTAQHHLIVNGSKILLVEPLLLIELAICMTPRG